MNQLNGFNEDKSDHSSKSSSSSSPQSFHPNNSTNPVEQFSESCHERLIQTLLGEHSGLINFSENKALSPQQNHKVQENECKDVSLIQFDDTGDSTKELDEIDHIEVTNYIRLKREPNFHAYLYSVKLEPPLKDRKLVRNILAYKNVMDRLKANPLILGSKIILPQQIPSFEMYPITIQDVPGCRYKLMVTFIHEIPLDDQLLLFNLIFKRVMKELNQAFMKSKHFDKNRIIDLEEWVMEIWPGYARKYTKIADNELMLMCDISNVVLHRKNVYDNLKLLMPNLRFRQFACQYLVGQTVLAKYNGKTYRIDEIDFDSNPNSKFRWGSQLLTYTQYFKQHWQINIKHTKQPLLVHKKYTYQTNSYRPIYLLPELCYLTGNSMVKDCSTFYKIIAHKHPSHDLRYYKLMKYIDSVNDHVPAKNILKEWGLTIERNSYTALSDQHAEELVIKEGDNIPTFNNSNRFVKMKNFQHNLGHLKRQSLLKPVSIAGNWLVIYLRSDKFIVDCFVRDIRRVAKNMGVDLQLPRLKSLISSSPSTYLQAIKDGRETDDKIILIITPGNINVKQRYDDIRKYCTVQLGVPVQFLCGGNIGQPHLLSKISPNILMEMICKVGGTPWGIQMPLKSVMYVGISICHRREVPLKSIIGFVSSTDSNATSWFSKSFIINDFYRSDVCDENLITAMSEALYKYRDHNGSLPAFIIIYRDDVGISLETLCDHEYPMITDAIREVYTLDAVTNETQHSNGLMVDDDNNGNVMPYIVFLATARQPTSFLSLNELDSNFVNTSTSTNVPVAKLIDIDDEVVEKECKLIEQFDEFYLASQKTTKTCVCPVRIRILRNSPSKTSNKLTEYSQLLTTQYLQSLSYKLSYLYFNTTEVARKPAPSIYSYRIAKYFCEHLDEDPSLILEDKLYYI